MYINCFKMQQKDLISILDNVYQNVIVYKKDKDGNIIDSITYHNKIMPQFVTNLFNNLLNTPSQYNVYNPLSTSSIISETRTKYLAIGIQYGATGIDIQNNKICLVNLDYYPSLTYPWPGQLAVPLVISSSVVYDKVNDYYRSAIRNSLQYAMVEKIYSITVGNYAFPNGIEYRFSLKENDLSPSITIGNNNIRKVVNPYTDIKSTTFTVFSEIALIGLPEYFVMSETGWSDMYNVQPYPILAYIAFNTALMKNEDILYDFKWQIWFDY